MQHDGITVAKKETKCHLSYVVYFCFIYSITLAVNLYNFIFDSSEKAASVLCSSCTASSDLTSVAYVAPLSAHRKQVGMRVSEVGCVTIATS